MDINTQIANHLAYTGFLESTYHTKKLRDHWAQNSYDPHILFEVKVRGHYAPLLKWTPEETDEWINENREKSFSHWVGDQEYYFDWGTGENKVTEDRMHKPHLDHIIPKARYYELYPDGNCDEPSNIRIVCARVNYNKGDSLEDSETVASMLDGLTLIKDKEKWFPVIEQRMKELKELK